MEFDGLFEDLESLFLAGRREQDRSNPFDRMRILGLRLSSQQLQWLIAPIRGSGFFAGMDPEFALWHIFPDRAIIDISASESPALGSPAPDSPGPESPTSESVVSSQLSGGYEDNLPLLRAIETDLASLIAELPLPARARWSLEYQPEEFYRGDLLQVENDCLFFVSETGRQNFIVPIASLHRLAIDSVDNLSGEI